MAVRRDMCNGVSGKARMMVDRINNVGVAKLGVYYAQHYPKRNFRKSLQLIRSAALYGYTDTGRKFSVSRQYVEQTLKEFYCVALMIENKKEDQGNNG